MAHAGALSLSLIFAALATASAQADRNYGKLPLAFELNVGQTDSQALFLTRGHGMTTFFTESGAIMTLDNGERQAAVRMNLAAARPARAVGLEKLPGVTNYFIGNDPKKWRTNVPNYARIRYQDVYPGVDLVWYGNQRQLEYDFVVAPGADPDQIQVAYDGVESLRVDGGDLVLRTALGDVRQKRPRVYQDIGGQRVEVAARYTLRARRRVSFELAHYDRTRELRIDPVVLVYWTDLAGADTDWATGIAVDKASSAYITGWTNSTDFPTQTAYQATLPGNPAAFVTKLTPAGDALVYSTFLGGPGQTEASGIAVDAEGAAHVAGYTSSRNFPTASAYQVNHQGGTYDGFVTKLSPAGDALIYSTYLGGDGSDRVFGIAVSASGAAYVTGATDSMQFPTHSPYQTNQGSTDAFVAKFSPAGAVAYSTYLGGEAEDYGNAIAVDASGSAYVTGYTESRTSFPAVSAYQPANRGQTDCFAAKLSPAGDSLLYSTFLGGSSVDMARAIAVDRAGSAYIAGVTLSTDFPTQSAYRPKAPAEVSGFVTKLAPSGRALVYSTYLGGAGYSTYLGGGAAEAIAVDVEGSAYITGSTISADFPLEAPYQEFLQGETSAFVTKLTAAGDALAFSTYLADPGGRAAALGRGIAVDSAGAAYVAGWTGTTIFDPPMSYPYYNAFVAKVELRRDRVVIATNPAGLALIVDGVTHTAPAVFPWAAGSAHTIGVASPQQQGDGWRRVFAGWSDGGAQTHSITTPAEGATYTADFTLQYRLITAASPPAYGTVLVSPPSPDGYYDFPSQVQVTARANPGYRFSEWSGDAYGSSGTCTLSMTAPRNVTAVFRNPLHTRVTTSPAGLAIVVDGVSLTAPQTFDWSPGSVHSVNAPSPQSVGDARYKYSAWSDGGAQTHSIAASPDALFTASFKRTYPLTTSSSPPEGGTVTLSPASPDGFYTLFSVVRFTATPNPGYRFSHWTGSQSGTDNPQELCIERPGHVTAVFESVPVINAVRDSASGRPVIAPNSFVTIYGLSFTTSTLDWSGAIQNGALPTTLGGVRVRINGKDAYISYTQPDQLNALTPPDTAAGSVSVEVITATGTATATAVMAPVAPALFGYSLSGKFYAVAQIANTWTLVAPVGAFGETPSHPAQTGDYLVLWALGMGPTNPAAPSGRLLDTAYPITDLSRIKVKFGALDAPVLWAGLVMPGLFQVNVQTPPGLSGEQPVVLTVDGAASQPNAFLLFQ